MPARRLALVRAAFLAALLAAPSFAQVTTHTSLAAFNAAAGNPPVAVTFDDLAPGTDLSGVHRGGVTFVATGAPLLVVAAAATFTPGGFSGAPNPLANILPATTGAHILSPGGVVLGPGFDPAIEDDGLTVTFDAPTAAFGFDHLSQSADGFSLTSIQVKDANGAVLFSGTVPISNLGGGGAAAGADFFGVVATSAIIKSVVVSEGDSNSQFPDCNIGYDTLRFTPSAVPAAATFALGGGCGAGAPTLFASPPLLGGAATLSVTGCTSNAGGQLLASGPAAPLPLAAGCTVWIDLAAPVVLAPVVVDAAGAWTLTVPVPFDPTLAGVALVLQAYVAPTVGPLGLDLTGGFAVVFGY